MIKFKLTENHYDLKKGTVVLDQGISDPETEQTKVEHRLVIIEKDEIPITYIVPLNKLKKFDK